MESGTKDGCSTAMQAGDVLKRIESRIEGNPLLREVYYKKDADFTDLIKRYNGEKVMIAVQLIESYRILCEMCQRDVD